ncbi:MAG: von Willebrand factor type A domain-containing protein [Planctomycetes bacterium]|nr:von Willebrand factor type A domain-containing protein [Planctomycetota bacterium]
MKTKTPKLGTALMLAAIGGLVFTAACGSPTYEKRDSGGACGGAVSADMYAEQQEANRALVPENGLLDSRYDGQPPVEDPRTDTGEPFDEFFKKYGTNPFVDTEDDRLSTFAVDVDTGSYTKCRDYLNRGYMPPDEAPRTEEFVNFFDYNYDAPRDGAFAIDVAGAPSRYGQDLKNCYLLRVGMQAKRIDPLERKPAILTFVIDVSGSMDMENRLGLVKRALKLLVNQMTERDRIGIAVYGDRGYKILDHTVATETETIMSAITRLQPDGSTYAEEGIRVGYQMAADSFREGYINRVILCSDGVANVGNTSTEKILETIAENRRKGITLSTIGFGMSNYNDTLMEQLGDKGDGHYAYVDTIDEAKRVFVDNLTGTLQVIARDTKVQVEFNPKVVKSYRLLGYENRDVADEDFRNDSVDGGEVGSGHSVTALYEVKLFEKVTGPICTATMRWKHDEKQEFIELSKELFVKDLAASWEEAPANMRLAANAAEFAELMKKSYWAKKGSYDELLQDTKSLINKTDDTSVLELATLITKARDLSKEAAGTAGGE